MNGKYHYRICLDQFLKANSSGVLEVKDETTTKTLHVLNEKTNESPRKAENVPVNINFKTKTIYSPDTYAICQE